MDDLKNYCCQNKNCPKHGVRGEENIRVRARYSQGQRITLGKLVYPEKRKNVIFLLFERQEELMSNNRQPAKNIENAVEKRNDKKQVEAVCEKFFGRRRSSE